MTTIGSYHVKVRIQSTAEEIAYLSPARENDMPTNWSCNWLNIWKNTSFECQEKIYMASDFHEQQQQNSASYMKANGEKQSYTSSDEIRVGSSEVMTHAQRQAFLKTSHWGKLFGVAHLLPEVKALTNIESGQRTDTKVEMELSVSEKIFLQNVLRTSHSYFGKIYYALALSLKENLAQ